MHSGISQHSKGNTKYIIYSVFQNMKDINLDLERHSNHIKNLKKVNKPFKVLGGVYKDLNNNVHEEFSIIEPVKSNLEVACIRAIHKQECVLVLDNDKHGLYKAKLVYEDHIENIGYFRQVPEHIAKQQDNYTRDGTNYYICTKSNSVMTKDLEKENLK